MLLLLSIIIIIIISITIITINNNDKCIENLLLLLFALNIWHKIFAFDKSLATVLFRKYTKKRIQYVLLMLLLQLCKKYLFKMLKQIKKNSVHEQVSSVINLDTGFML